MATSQESGLVRRRRLPPPAATVVYELEPEARREILPVLNALGRFGAFVFRSAAAGTIEPLLTQMRLNGHWVLAKGIDFEATYRLRVGPHNFGLTVGPTTFEPSARPPEEPTATIESDPITMTNLFNAGVTLAEAEAAGTLRISGDRPAALGLLDRLALGPHLS